MIQVIQSEEDYAVLKYLNKKGKKIELSSWWMATKSGEKEGKKRGKMWRPERTESFEMSLS